MEHFISIVFDNKPDSNFSRVFLSCFDNINESLMESETDYIVFESRGNIVYRVAMKENLVNTEADKLADHLYTHLYTQGYDNFDIEISGGEDA